MDETAQAFLQLATRRKNVHGEWLPVAYWAKRIGTRAGNDMKESKLIKILEQQGLLNMVLEAHDDIHVEVLARKVLVGDSSSAPKKRQFICISSPNKPETDTENPAKLGSVLQDAWNTFFNSQRPQQQEQQERPPQKEQEQESDDDEVQMNQQASPAADMNSPLMQARRVTPPSVASPALEADKDLRDLFRNLINPKYLSASDLFLDSSSPADIHSKLHSFGTKVAAKSNNNHYQRVRKLFHEEFNCRKVPIWRQNVDLL